MNITTYNERCQILANLASEAIKLEGLDAKTKDELESLRKTILTNHYRITLLGSFGGGKSTIFDTACGGGRELSPTGFGIRTSAVPAEAHAIEVGEKEHAIVNWKTDNEILSSFIEVISPELRDLAGGKFKEASNKEIIERISLAKTEDLKLLQRAMADALKHLAEDKILLKEHKLPEAPASSSRMELLRIGNLVLRYYENFRMATDVFSERQTKSSIEEATRIVRFPEDWHLSDRDSTNGWHAVRFLFVRSVAFHVHSPDLSRLKAILVDCPGLHASLWDNEIVHDCIKKSDAIIWLQGDQGKELGMAEIDEARRFSEYGITSEGIFLAFNAKGVSKVTAERILDSNLAKMKELAHLEIPAERVAIFNALLALRAKQALATLSGDLTLETIEALSSKAIHQVGADKLPEQGENRKVNAKYLIKRDIRRQADQFLEKEIEDPWDEATLENLLRTSRWEEVIGQATQFIVDTKGRTRLIKRGAQPILEAISSFEESLKLAQERVTLNLEEYRKSKKEAEAALKDFGHKVDGLLLPYERDLRHTIEADIGIGFGVRGELLARFKSKRAMNSLLKELEAAIDNVHQERDVKDSVRAATVDWMKSIITGWQVDLRAGKSNTIKYFQQDEMKKLEATMMEFLQIAIGQGGGLIGGVSFTIPEIEDQVLIGYQTQTQALKSDMDWIMDQTDKVHFLRPLRDGYEAIRRKLTGYPFDRNHWKKRLTDYIKDLSTIIDGKVSEHVTHDFLNVYFEAIANQIKAAKVQMRKEFQSRIDAIEKELQKTQQERVELARRAKEIRNAVIKPFRERVETFIEETEAALPDAQ
jgi:hypothetical protein